MTSNLNAKASLLCAICLLSCKEGGAGGEAIRHAGQRGQSSPVEITPPTDIQVPAEPLWPGTKKVGVLNRMLKNCGSTCSVRLVFHDGEADEICFTAPEVRQGSAELSSGKNRIRILPKRAIGIWEGDQLLRTVQGVPRWTICFTTSGVSSEEADGKTASYLLQGVMDGEGRVSGFPSIFPAGPDPFEDGLGVRVTIEFSDDFEGSRGDWYVWKSV